MSDSYGSDLLRLTLYSSQLKPVCQAQAQSKQAVFLHSGQATWRGLYHGVSLMSSMFHLCSAHLRRIRLIPVSFQLDVFCVENSRTMGVWAKELVGESQEEYAVFEDFTHLLLKRANDNLSLVLFPFCIRQNSLHLLSTDTLWLNWKLAAFRTRQRYQ